MSEYNGIIERMNEVVQDYNNMKGLDGPTLNSMLKRMSTMLYYLESVRSDFHDKWNVCVKHNIDSGESVSRSENIAHVKYPEMYRLRRVMTSGYKVLDAIRSNLSYLKQELNTVNTN